MNHAPGSAGFVIDEQNPWPGLNVFHEEAERFFRGREAELAELLRLVSQAPLTLLFGKSGLGKTSLLQAGLFPLLRQQNIFPVYVRLDMREQAAPLIEQAAAVLLAEINKHDVESSQPRKNESLWEYLHIRHMQWWSSRNQPLTPLFVFDQFEEVFTLGTENADAVRQLWGDLADMIENRIPADLARRIEIEIEKESGHEWEDALSLRGQHYKVLLSFREEYLPNVEDLKAELPSRIHNRLRLLPMSAGRAVEVVTGKTPEGKLHELVNDDETAREIVHFVAVAQDGGKETGLGKDSRNKTEAQWEGLEIEPALLSLVCQGLNEKRKALKQAAIDAVLLKNTGASIICDFYKRCLKDVPKTSQHFIEDKLITEGGFRNSYPVQEALDQGEITEPVLRRLVDRCLLRIDHQLGIERVELIHDRLTSVVRERRTQRREERKHKLWSMAVALASTIALALLCELIIALRAEEKAKSALEQATVLKLGFQSGASLSENQRSSDQESIQLALAAFRMGGQEERAIQRLANASFSIVPNKSIPKSGRVDVFAFSPDSRRIALGGSDGYVRIVNSSNGALIAKSTNRHKDAITSLAFSPNGELIASGSKDNTIQRWRAATGAPIGEPLTVDNGAVWTLAFSSDGKRIVSASGLTLSLWDAVTGTRLGEPLRDGHWGYIKSVAFSPDGHRIVSGGSDHTLRLWNATTGAVIGKPLNGHRGEVVSVAFSPDGKRIVSGGYDKTVRLWDAFTGEQLFSGGFAGHEAGVNSVAFSLDGRRIISGDGDGAILMWDAGSGESLGELVREHMGSVLHLAFSPDGRQIAASFADETLRLWEVAGHIPLTGHKEGVTSVGFSPNGERIVSGGDDKTLRVWDVATGSPVGNPLYEGDSDAVASVAWSPDGRRMASGGVNGVVRLRDAATGMVISKQETVHQNRVLALTFSADGERLASGGWDGVVQFWDGFSGLPIGSPIKGLGAPVGSIAFSPDGKYIAVGGRDGTISLRNAETGAVIGSPYKGHSGVVGGVAFSPNGKRLVSGGGDGKVLFWDLDSGVSSGGQFERHRGAVLSVAFSSDGKRVVSGGADNMVRLWNASNGEAIRRSLRGHTREVVSVAFSPDGSRIVSGSRDGAIRLWRVGKPEHLCERLQSNLSHAEWKKYAGDIRYVKQCPELPGPED